MNIPATERDKRRMCINIYLYIKSSCSLSNEMQGPRSSLLTDLERFSAQDHKKTQECISDSGRRHQQFPH